MMDCEIFEQRTQEFVDVIKELPEVKEHLLKEPWTGGPLYNVSPVTIWRNVVELYWDETTEPTDTIKEIKQIGKRMKVVKEVKFEEKYDTNQYVIRIKLVQDNW